MKPIYKIIAVAVGLLINSSINAQVSFSAGTGMVNGFGPEKKSFFGLHGGIELPRNNDVTFYGRFAHYFSRPEGSTQTTSVTIQDLTNTNLPYSLLVDYNQTYNYTTFEGGTRYYLGNDYDNGFSAYGGTNFMLVFNSIKINYENNGYFEALNQDTQEIETYIHENWENDYQLNSANDSRGLIMNLAIGLQGGLKYTIPAVGTAYFDVSGQYSILVAPSSEQLYTSQHSPLFFVFTVGFRKDLY